MLNQPAFTELQQEDSHPDIILQETLINLGIHFPLNDVKLFSARGSKASNHDAPSTALHLCFHVGIYSFSSQPAFH